MFQTFTIANNCTLNRGIQQQESTRRHGIESLDTYLSSEVFGTEKNNESSAYSDDWRVNVFGDIINSSRFAILVGCIGFSG